MTDNISDNDVGARLKKLVSVLTGIDVNKITRDSSLWHDLDIDGDDVDELFMDMQREFSIDMSDFDVSGCFKSEPHIFSAILGLFKKDLPPSKKMTVGDLIEAVELRIKNRT